MTHSISTERLREIVAINADETNSVSLGDRYCVARREGKPWFVYRMGYEIHAPNTVPYDDLWDAIECALAQKELDRRERSNEHR